MQNLEIFELPKGFRGRNPFIVQLWWIVQGSLFRLSPQFMYGWRRFLLRLFGARIGKKVIIRPTAKVTYPWKLTIGDFSWIGDNVGLYNLGHITIGKNTVVSQGSYLCAGTHDYAKIEFPISSNPIQIGDQCWLAAFVFVGPDVRIEDNTVVGARSSVFNNLDGGNVYFGNPAKFQKKRPNA